MKFTGNTHRRKGRVKSGFNVLKVVILARKTKKRSGQPKKFEDEELAELLEQDPCQTLQELANSLNVDLSTVGKRLKAIGMIQTQGKWLPQ